jgi:mycothiol synthase
MTLRPPRDDEFDAMLALMNAHQLAAFGEADVTADELRSWLTAPSVVIERDIRVLERDGRLVGYADVDGTREDPPLWWCDVKVAPDVAADEVVPELVAWLDERAETGRLRVWTSDEDARVVDAFATLGFVPVRHSYRMEIDLAGDEREPTWPDGISVRTATEADHRLVYSTVIEVWQDTNDTYDETFEEWAHWLIESPSYDPSIWFLALAGDELAGFSICRQDPNDSNAGYVGMLGVRRAWRRQGLGEALLLRSFAEFRRRGLTRGTLGVDASSATGATRLYERAGMSVYRDTVFLERPVRFRP